VTSTEHAAFREQARAWLAEAVASLPARPPRDDWAARRAYDTGWQRIEYDAGFAGLGLPAALGGRDATLLEQLIYMEERARAGAPPHGCNLVGVTHAAPTVASEGTDEQRRMLIPAILRGEEIWCQGFSETEAGSDLAALRCRAARDGEDYVINGHKIWTTHAQVADRCELLVRTDPAAPRHKGITYLALPMRLDGITVRPIRTIAGEREFAEVTFEDVRCPVEHRVGAENDGWRVAMVTFSHERGTTFVYDLVTARVKLERLARLAREIPAGRCGATAWDDAGMRSDFGRLAAELDAMWALTRRAVTDAMAGRPPGPAVSVGKLFFTEVLTKVDDLALRLIGDGALVLDNDLDVAHTGDLVHDRLFHTSFTIAGGTSQIQRNIIAERVLGLPREPAWDR
jgi:alkylation response protein AidB-like acyl-CoA dehydrogenase